MRRFLLVLTAVGALVVVAAGPANAVSGAGYTTVNTAVDGSNHCKNGNPGVNCNIYDGKQYVWLNGGPAANGLGPDGSYFFAVLEPGGQPKPNDAGAIPSVGGKNLSDDFDAYTNRTFTVTNGEVSAYAGTHWFDNGVAGAPVLSNSAPFIRLFPYADTTNPGGVYIMAICSLGAGYPVDPRDCKYDAFKVKSGVARVQSVISGRKYLDANTNGQLDGGEPGLKDWSINIVGTDGTNTTLLTSGSGQWSYTTPAHAPTAGTTTYTITETQQSGWVQTGNTVNQTMTAGGANASLAAFTYTVTVPNNAVSAVEELNFGNFRDNPPQCPDPTFGTNAQGVPYMQIVVQDADSGLASIEIVYTRNITVDIAGFSFGTKSPVTVTGTAIDAALSMGLTFIATDLAGNRTECDPVLATLGTEGGKPTLQTFSALPQAESNVVIRNGSFGVSGADVIVNGTVYRVRGLRAGEDAVLDVSASMLPGAVNEISVVLYGRPGSSATIFISD
jgi:hypothetical protein